MKTVLILSQVYVPDPTSVGQHLADVAKELVERGFRVVVVTANRGYDDPSVRYKLRERIDGVEVLRLPFSSFGKKSLLQRVIGGGLFLLQAILLGLCVRGVSCLLISTSPPLSPVAALVISYIRRVPVKYWVMDLNPDQVVAMGLFSADAWPVRAFEALNRLILARASAVITLDRFMAQRLLNKQPIQHKLTVLPPWPHTDGTEQVHHDQNPFRKEHSLTGKFVVMFSGNMSLVSPIDTVVEAALRLQDDPDLVFVFIGGGAGKRALDKRLDKIKPKNIMSLPYQPLSRIKYSLSSADVHLVSMGDAMVGVCHPCKVYGAMAVARPILLLGPQRCHVMDIIQREGIGWRVGHSQIEEAVNLIQKIRHTDQRQLAAMGNTAQAAIIKGYRKHQLCGAFCDIVQQDIG